jgi:hypothetical protein
MSSRIVPIVLGYDSADFSVTSGGGLGRTIRGIRVRFGREAESLSDGADLIASEKIRGDKDDFEIRVYFNERATYATKGSVKSPARVDPEKRRPRRAEGSTA